LYTYSSKPTESDVEKNIFTFLADSGNSPDLDISSSEILIRKEEIDSEVFDKHMLLHGSNINSEKIVIAMDYQTNLPAPVDNDNISAEAYTHKGGADVTDPLTGDLLGLFSTIADAKNPALPAVLTKTLKLGDENAPMYTGHIKLSFTDGDFDYKSNVGEHELKLDATHPNVNLFKAINSPYEDLSSVAKDSIQGGFDNTFNMTNSILNKDYFLKRDPINNQVKTSDFAYPSIVNDNNSSVTDPVYNKLDATIVNEGPNKPLFGTLKFDQPELDVNVRKNTDSTSTMALLNKGSDNFLSGLPSTIAESEFEQLFSDNDLKKTGNNLEFKIVVGDDVQGGYQLNNNDAYIESNLVDYPVFTSNDDAISLNEKYTDTIHNTEGALNNHKLQITNGTILIDSDVMDENSQNYNSNTKLFDLLDGFEKLTADVIGEIHDLSAPALISVVDTNNNLNDDLSRFEKTNSNNNHVNKLVVSYHDSESDYLQESGVLSDLLKNNYFVESDVTVLAKSTSNSESYLWNAPADVATDNNSVLVFSNDPLYDSVLYDKNNVNDFNAEGLNNLIGSNKFCLLQIKKNLDFEDSEETKVLKSVDGESIDGINTSITLSEANLNTINSDDLRVKIVCKKMSDIPSFTNITTNVKSFNYKVTDYLGNHTGDSDNSGFLITTKKSKVSYDELGIIYDFMNSTAESLEIELKILSNTDLANQYVANKDLLETYASIKLTNSNKVVTTKVSDCDFKLEQIASSTVEGSEPMSLDGCKMDGQNIPSYYQVKKMTTTRVLDVYVKLSILYDNLWLKTQITEVTEWHVLYNTSKGHIMPDYFLSKIMNGVDNSQKFLANRYFKDESNISITHISSKATFTKDQLKGFTSVVEYHNNSGWHQFTLGNTYNNNVDLKYDTPTELNLYAFPAGYVPDYVPGPVDPIYFGKIFIRLDPDQGVILGRVSDKDSQEVHHYLINISTAKGINSFSASGYIYDIQEDSRYFNKTLTTWSPYNASNFFLKNGNNYVGTSISDLVTSVKLIEDGNSTNNLEEVQKVKVTIKKQNTELISFVSDKLILEQFNVIINREQIIQHDYLIYGREQDKYNPATGMPAHEYLHVKSYENNSHRYFAKLNFGSQNLNGVRVEINKKSDRGDYANFKLKGDRVLIDLCVDPVNLNNKYSGLYNNNTNNHEIKPTESGVPKSTDSLIHRNIRPKQFRGYRNKLPYIKVIRTPAKVLFNIHDKIYDSMSKTELGEINSLNNKLLLATKKLVDVLVAKSGANQEFVSLLSDLKDAQLTKDQKKTVMDTKKQEYDTAYAALTADYNANNKLSCSNKYSDYISAMNDYAVSSEALVSAQADFDHEKVVIEKIKSALEDAYSPISQILSDAELAVNANSNAISSIESILNDLTTRKNSAQTNYVLVSTLESYNSIYIPEGEDQAPYYSAVLGYIVDEQLNTGDDLITFLTNKLNTANQVSVSFAFQAQIAALQAQIAALQAQLDPLQSQASADLQAQIADLQAQIADLQAQVPKAQSELDAGENVIDYASTSKFTIYEAANYLLKLASVISAKVNVAVYTRVLGYIVNNQLNSATTLEGFLLNKLNDANQGSGANPTTEEQIASLRDQIAALEIQIQDAIDATGDTPKNLVSQKNDLENQLNILLNGGTLPPDEGVPPEVTPGGGAPGGGANGGPTNQGGSPDPLAIQNAQLDFAAGQKIIAYYQEFGVSIADATQYLLSLAQLELGLVKDVYERDTLVKLAIAADDLTKLTNINIDLLYSTSKNFAAFTSLAYVFTVIESLYKYDNLVDMIFEIFGTDDLAFNESVILNVVENLGSCMDFAKVVILDLSSKSNSNEVLEYAFSEGFLNLKDSIESGFNDMKTWSSLDVPINDASSVITLINTKYDNMTNKKSVWANLLTTVFVNYVEPSISNRSYLSLNRTYTVSNMVTSSKFIGDLGLTFESNYSMYPKMITNKNIKVEVTPADLKITLENPLNSVLNKDIISNVSNNTLYSFDNCNIIARRFKVYSKENFSFKIKVQDMKVYHTPKYIDHPIIYTFDDWSELVTITDQHLRANYFLIQNDNSEGVVSFKRTKTFVSSHKKYIIMPKPIAWLEARNTKYTPSELPSNLTGSDPLLGGVTVTRMYLDVNLYNVLKPNKPFDYNPDLTLPNPVNSLEPGLNNLQLLLKVSNYLSLRQQEQQSFHFKMTTNKLKIYLVVGVSHVGEEYNSAQSNSQTKMLVFNNYISNLNDLNYWDDYYVKSINNSFTNKLWNLNFQQPINPIEGYLTLDPMSLNSKNIYLEGISSHLLGNYYLDLYPLDSVVLKYYSINQNYDYEENKLIVELNRLSTMSVNNWMQDDKFFQIAQSFAPTIVKTEKHTFDVNIPNVLTNTPINISKVLEQKIKDYINSPSRTINWVLHESEDVPCPFRFIALSTKGMGSLIDLFNLNNDYRYKLLPIVRPNYLELRNSAGVKTFVINKDGYLYSPQILTNECNLSPFNLSLGLSKLPDLSIISQINDTL
jgi:hypothetical protein